MEKSVLEHTLSIADWWMSFSAIVVAVGILGEYVLLACDKETRRNKATMVLSLLFGALVLAGVVGEYLSGKKVSATSDSLQSLEDREIALAKRDAAWANAKAAQANADAEHADDKAADACRQAAISLERAKAADERASRNELEAARLTKVAEEERLARLRLEAAFVPRRLTASDQAAMAVKLRVFAGMRALIVYRDQGSEPFAFASDIKRMLLHAQWLPTTPEPEATILSDGAPLAITLRTGVWLTYSPIGITFAAAQALARVLTDGGFEVHVERASSLSQFYNASVVSIALEPRPVGVQGMMGGAERRETTLSRPF